MSLPYWLGKVGRENAVNIAACTEALQPAIVLLLIIIKLDNVDHLSRFECQLIIILRVIRMSGHNL